MHKIVVSSIGLTLFLLSSVTWADGNPKQAIQTVYTHISDALSSKDIDAVMATRDDGYQAITSSGRVQTDGKEAERQRLERVFAHSTSISDEEVVQFITMIGKDAAVVVKLDYTRTEEDPERGLVGKVHEEGTKRDFWVNHDGTWLLKRERGIHVKNH